MKALQNDRNDIQTTDLNVPTKAEIERELEHAQLKRQMITGQIDEMQQSGKGISSKLEKELEAWDEKIQSLNTILQDPNITPDSITKVPSSKQKEHITSSQASKQSSNYGGLTPPPTAALQGQNVSLSIDRQLSEEKAQERALIQESLGKIDRLIGSFDNNMEALNQLPRLICNGTKPDLSAVSDKEFKNIVFLIMGSMDANTLPVDHELSCGAVQTKSQQFSQEARENLEQFLDTMLKARNYILPDEVVYHVMNVKLHNFYNTIIDNLDRTKKEIDDLPDSRQKDKLDSSFRKIEEKAINIINRKKQKIQESCVKCLEAFLNNLHSRPDDHMGLDPKTRFKRIMNYLTEFPEYVLDLRGTHLGEIGECLRRIESDDEEKSLTNNLDISKIILLLDPEQEKTYLTQKQREERGPGMIFKAAKYGPFAQIITLYHKDKNIINYTDDEGRTPLMLACMAYQYKIADSLIGLRANVNARTKTHYLIIDGLLLREKTTERDNIIKLLQRNGSEETNDIYFLSAMNNLAKAKIVYTKDTINKLKKSHGYAPLHIAILNGNLDNVKWLCTHGAGVNLKDRNGMTPLHLACERGFTDITLHLLAHKADVNAKSGEEVVKPIVKPEKKGRFRSLSNLFGRGSQPVQPNIAIGPDYSFMPLDKAVDNGHFDLVRQVRVVYPNAKLSPAREEIFQQTLQQEGLSLPNPVVQPNVEEKKKDVQPHI